MYCALEDAPWSQNVEWSAHALKVSCLAQALNLSAKALLVSLDVTNKNNGDDYPPELDKSSVELSPSLATNHVARTII